MKSWKKTLAKILSKYSLIDDYKTCRQVNALKAFVVLSFLRSQDHKSGLEYIKYIAS